jgi:4-amino-4-deoxy-L-arabinose transferase-like glycosyltransferase
MNMLSIVQSKRGEEYREEEERLTKKTEKAITYLSIRDFTNRDLTAVLSKPIELIGDFKKKDKFKKLIREVNRENAYNIKRRGQVSIKETYY